MRRPRQHRETKCAGGEPAAGAALEVRAIKKAFGGLVAVDDLTLEVPAAGSLGVIGPNGAGKSTLLRLISGELRPDGGRILLDGDRIDGRPRHRVARAGVAYAHQIPRPFLGLTVKENLRVGSHAGRGRTLAGFERIESVLELTELADNADRQARDLGVLDQKRLGLARALVAAPRLLLLDEVGAGLVPAELDHIIGLVRRVNALGVTILVVEHVESVIRSVAERVLVLDWGRRIAEGTPDEIAANERVRAVYLGEGDWSTAAMGRPRSKRGPRGTVLEVSGIAARYGGAVALDDVSLTVDTGEVVGVVGANGSGKTTLSRVISGLKSPSSGRIVFKDRDITALSPRRRVDLGIAHCQEGRRIFGELTVAENLALGAYPQRARPKLSEHLARVYELFPFLEERRDQLGGSLSGGEQQMLAISRSLMSDPVLLVLDEASLGLAPLMVDRIYEAIEEIHRRGVSVLLVEQTVYKSVAVADHVYVLDHGKLAFSGSPEHFESDSDLATVYFGDSGRGSDQAAEELP